MRKFILVFTLFSWTVVAQRTIPADHIKTTQGSPRTTWSIQNGEVTDTFVGRSSTDTLTNKSIDGNTNTLTNLPASALTGKVPIATGGTNETSQVSNGVTYFNGTGITSDASLTWDTIKLTNGGLFYGTNGNNAGPEYSFSNDTASGLYLLTAGEMGIAIGGAEALDFKESTGSFGNVGMGSAASTSDNFPLLIQRSNSSTQTTAQISNPSTTANANATFQVATDSGNVLGNVSAYTSASTVVPYASSMVLRANNAAAHLTLIGGDNAGDDVRIWTNGDYTSAGETASFNGDHTTTLFGGLHFNGSSSGTFTQLVPSAITSYSVTWPSAQGTGGLTNNGSGGLSWTSVWPLSAGGTNNGSLAATAGGVLYTDGTKVVNSGAGSSGLTLVSNGSGAPTWAAVAAGTKNYLGTINGTNNNGNFETGAVGSWVTGHASLTSNIPTGSPTFGSGASSNLTLAVSNSTPAPLAGSWSLGETSAATSIAGDFLASPAFTIDSEDQAKALTFTFYYTIAFGASSFNFSGTSSNTFGVAIYDVTNSQWIIPAGVFGMTQGTGTSAASAGVGLATGTFQTSATGTQYRFVVYNANAAANITIMDYDDFYVGPQTAPIGAVVTDWVAYTPANTNSWSTNTTYAGQWRRVGGDMEIQGRIILSGAVSGSALINLPSGYSIDTTRFSQGTVAFNFGIPLGIWGASNSGASINANGSIVYQGNNAGYLLYQDATSGNTSTSVTGTAPMTWTSGDNLNVMFKVPITGWSSNVQMSNTTDTRVVALKVHTTTAANAGTLTGSGTFTAVKYDTVDQDTHGAYSTSTGQYTVPVTGDYDISACIQTSGSQILGTAIQLDIFNVTTSTELAQYQLVSGGSITNNIVTPINTKSLFLTAGTVIEIRSAFTGTYTSGAYSVVVLNNAFFFTLSRVGGPSVVAATESVNMRAHDTSGLTIGTSFANYVFGTKDFDTHNAYNASTGIFTCPVTGKYLVAESVFTTNVTLSTTQFYNTEILLGGSQQSASQITGGGGTSVIYQSGLTDIVNCTQGGTINVGTRSSVATTSNGGGFLTIERVGN